MANGDRSKRIRQRVLDRLGASGVGRITPEKVYRTLDDVQRFLTEELLCLEAQWDIHVSAGDSLVNTPPDFIAERVITPSSGSTPLDKISLKRRDALVREYNATVNSEIATTSSGDAYYYYQWNDQFGFLLANGSAPASDLEFVCFYWRHPNPSEVISETKDPILKQRYDRVLEYGAAYEISGRADDYQRYMVEVERLRSLNNVTNMAAQDVPQQRDYD